MLVYPAVGQGVPGQKDSLPGRGIKGPYKLGAFLAPTMGRCSTLLMLEDTMGLMLFLVTVRHGSVETRQRNERRAG